MTKDEAVKYFLYGPDSTYYIQGLQGGKNLIDYFDKKIYEAIKNKKFYVIFNEQEGSEIANSTKDETGWLYLYAKDKGFNVFWLGEDYFSHKAFCCEWLF